MEDLELNNSIRVEDVMIDNFEIMNSPRIPIASVSLTRELKQEEATVAAGAVAAAPVEGAAATAAAPAEAGKGKEKEKEKEKGKGKGK